MSARAILRTAYSLGLVPHQLHGKTQHKTLQARLSEDILYRKEKSPFFRTKPGTFFLRRFLTDADVPVEHRREMTARRRTRELLRGPALALDIAALTSNSEHSVSWDPHRALCLIHEGGCYSYIDPRSNDNERTLLWSFASVVRDFKVLTYRVGRYRDDRDHFAQKRSIGFTSLVLESDTTLFNPKALGIEDSAVNAVTTDLDIPLHQPHTDDSAFKYAWRLLTLCSRENSCDAIALVTVSAPNWFEPTGSRLSLNDLQWMDLTVRPNNIDDFDPWSRHILNYHFKVLQTDA